MILAVDWHLNMTYVINDKICTVHNKLIAATKTFGGFCGRLTPGIKFLLWDFTNYACFFVL